MGFIDCLNKNYKAIPAGWEVCAQNWGITVADIDACYQGSEGQNLLSQSMAKSNSVGIKGSPTIVIQGKEYQDARTEAAFIKALCAEIALENRPLICGNIPQTPTTPEPNQGGCGEE